MGAAHSSDARRGGDCLVYTPPVATAGLAALPVAVLGLISEACAGFDIDLCRLEVLIALSRRTFTEYQDVTATSP